MGSMDTVVGCGAGPVPRHAFLPHCPVILFRAWKLVLGSSEKSALFPLPHPSPPYGSHTLRASEFSLKQIAGLLPWNFWFNSLGLSRLVFPTSFQLMLVLWFSDHTLRTTAPERVALSLAALVCLVVLFPPLPSNFCVFSGA